MTFRSTLTIPPKSLPAIAAKLRSVKSNDPTISFPLADGLAMIEQVLKSPLPTYHPEKRRMLIELKATLHHLASLGILELP